MDAVFLLALVGIILVCVFNLEPRVGPLGRIVGIIVSVTLIIIFLVEFADPMAAPPPE